MKHVPWPRTAQLVTAALMLTLATTAVATDVVVIVNPAAEAPGKDVVADVFLGKSKTYTPFDQPEGSAVRADFYAKATGRDGPQVKATWSRLVFTGKAQLPKELPDAAAVKKAVAADPKAIGYIEKSALDSTVKAVLTLN